MGTHPFKMCRRFVEDWSSDEGSTDATVGIGVFQFVAICALLLWQRRERRRATEMSARLKLMS